MNTGRYDCRVFKASLIALALIVAFGLVFALLPSGVGSRDRTGVTLRGVQLKLFPGQDQNAEWRFSAPELHFDPVKNESTVSGLKVGQRWIVDPKTGAQVLDMTMQAAQLKIDENGNLRTDQARLYVPSQCAAVQLRGNAKDQVVVDQNAGYIAPSIRMTFPEGFAEYTDVTMSFNLDAKGTLGPNQTNLDSPYTCVNGQTVRRKS